MTCGARGFTPGPLWPPRPILVLGADGWEWADLSQLCSACLWRWRDECESKARFGSPRPDTVDLIDKALADRGETSRPEPVHWGDRPSRPYPMS